MRTALLVTSWLAVWLTCVTAQVRFLDDTDRNACRAWLVVLADAQFYRPTADVTDCAALVRHALREALRPHSPEWLRRWSIPGMPTYPDVRRPPATRNDSLPLFRVRGNRYAEFADARTIVALNSRRVGRSLALARPGDLLFYHQAASAEPDHLMVFIGPSAFDRTSNDWIVYHTGPDAGRPGEVRKVRASELLKHPSPRWRPVSENPAFIGVFRLAFL